MGYIGPNVKDTRRRTVGQLLRDGLLHHHCRSWRCLLKHPKSCCGILLHDCWSGWCLNNRDGMRRGVHVHGGNTKHSWAAIIGPGRRTRRGNLLRLDLLWRLLLRLRMLVTTSRPENLKVLLLRKLRKIIPLLLMLLWKVNTLLHRGRSRTKILTNRPRWH